MLRNFEHEGAQYASGLPADFPPVDIEDFVAFVLAGGEVVPEGLKGRVLRAEAIVFARDQRCLLGVAGLKHPSATHRKEVSTGADVDLPAEKYPLELGWVFILPSARGRKLSLHLCQPLIDVAAARGTFATSRSDNEPMHRTLAKLGFQRVGAPYESSRSDHDIVLFIREPAVASSAGLAAAAKAKTR